MRNIDGTPETSKWGPWSTQDEGWKRLGLIPDRPPEAAAEPETAEPETAEPEPRRAPRMLEESDLATLERELEEDQDLDQAEVRDLIHTARALRSSLHLTGREFQEATARAAKAESGDEARRLGRKVVELERQLSVAKERIEIHERLAAAQVAPVAAGLLARLGPGLEPPPKPAPVAEGTIAVTRECALERPPVECFQVGQAQRIIAEEHGDLSQRLRRATG